MNTTTVEYQRDTKIYRKQVLFDGQTFTAKLTNNISGSTRERGGWRSYRAALETVQDMYDDAIRQW